MELTQIITEKIKSAGPISFHDFMEMALYHPGFGYYSSAKPKIGKQGDYFTTPELTVLLGKLLAKQLEEMWQLLDKAPFTIVEFGAGNGKLCADLLGCLKNNHEMYRSLRYCIIEKSLALQKIQQEKLLEKVTWHHSIDELQFSNGCVIANEVLDNFAVHRVIQKRELMEIFVDVDVDNHFKEILRPASAPLKDYFEQLQVQLPEGCHAEVNLQAIQWLGDVAASIKKGFVITVDYGTTSELLYRKTATNGTLLCFYRQEANEKWYERIGEQDITAHVNFSALLYWGNQFGLQSCGYTLQSHFLHSLGLVPLLQRTSLEFYPLMIDTARKFKVLIQQKGLVHPSLSGMRISLSGNKPLATAGLF